MTDGKMLPAKFPTIRVPGRIWQLGLRRGWYVCGRRRPSLEFGWTATWLRLGQPPDRHASRQFTLTLHVGHWTIEVGRVVAFVQYSLTP